MYDPTPLKAKEAPEISGGSTIGIKYDKGILLGADTHLMYAGCYWYKDIKRINQISDNCLLASTGDYSDLQMVLKKIKDKHDSDVIADDGHLFYEPKDYCKWLANMHFNKRMRVDPYYNSHIVAGIHSKTGEKFLGTVDVHGNNFEGEYLLTGIANYFCNSILADHVTPELTLEGAKELMNKCFTALYYRDKTQGDKIQLVTINDNSEVTFEDTYTLESKWDYNFTTKMTNDETRDMRYNY